MEEEQQQVPTTSPGAVWPPPIAGVTGAVPRQRAISQTGYERTIGGLAIAYAALDVLIAAVASLPAAPGSTPVAVITIIGGLLGVLLLPVTIALGVFFLIWFHGVYKNLTGFGSTVLSTTPGWAVGFWFVPFVNLYRPYRSAQEIWRVSDPSTPYPTVPARRGYRQSRLIVAWWALYLLENVLATVIAYAGMQSDAGDAVLGIVRWIEVVVCLSALWFMYRMVKEINARQEAKENSILEREAQQSPSDSGRT